MKALHQLTNIEKAVLLHQLFPQEIPALLQFIEGMSQTITEDQQQQRSKWDNGLFNFDFWLSLTEEVDKAIKQYKNKLHKNHRLFADQLFDGYLAIYTVHCMVVYTTTRQHPSRKFSLAVDLLFNP